MNAKDKEELKEVVEALSSLTKVLTDGTVELRIVSSEASIKDLTNLLPDLRIYAKYKSLDLEATRRENQYLRKLLENNKGR